MSEAPPRLATVGPAERWIHCQQVRLLATLCNRGPVRCLWDLLPVLVNELRRAEELGWRAEAYPPAALLEVDKLCDDAVANCGEEPDLEPLLSRAPEFDEAIARLGLENRRAGPNASDCDPIRAAQILGHHILHGAAPALSLLRLAKCILSTRWERLADEPQVVEAMQEPIGRLRWPWSSTREREQAVRQLADSLGDAPHWAQVENVLYHHLYGWPLLLAGNADVSLPVGVDVDVSPPPRCRATVEVIPRGFVTTQWEDSLRFCVAVGKGLWHSKRGNHGGFRDSVRASRVRYDFSVAKDIAQVLPGGLRLAQRSMEAYFAQLVLARLLGRAPSMSSAVTGQIGAQLRGEDERDRLDWEFDWPAGAATKVRHVFRTGYFERIVLPSACKDRQESAEVSQMIAASQDCQTAEVDSAAHLSHVADCVQTCNWRRNQFVRCPDVAAHFERDRSRVTAAARDPDGEPEEHLPHTVRSCLRALKEASSAVWQAPDDVSVYNVADALWYINTIVRMQEQANPRPMLSLAFVRAVDDEQDERFWQTIWWLTGAPWHEFGDFQAASDPVQAAQSLASCLNQFEPAMNRPGHRAPDVLVLFGTEGFTESLRKTKTASARIHAFDAIVAEVARRSQLRSCDAPGDFAGLPRLIILSSSQHESRAGSARLCAEGVDAVRRLAAFRFGFTQAMAGVVLRGSLGGLDSAPGWLGSQVREVLDALVDAQHLRRIHGQYYLPATIRRQVDLDPNDVTASPRGKSANTRLGVAQLHSLCGEAMAPYASTRPLPGLAFDRCFDPEWVHGAAWHLAQAIHLTKGAPAHSPAWYTHSQSSQALSRLQRFADLACWDTALSIINSGQAAGYADEIAQDLLEAARMRGRQPHPNHLVMAARAAFGRCRELRTGGVQDLADDVHATTRLFQEALDEGCEARMGTGEWGFHRVIALGWFSAFLRWSGDRDDRARSAALWRELQELVSDQPDTLQVVPGELIEEWGDGDPDHATAAEIYAMAVRGDVKWYQAWGKCVGAYWLSAGALPEDVAKKLRGLEAADLRTVVKFTPKYLEGAVCHVAARITAGLAFLGPQPS